MQRIDYRAPLKPIHGIRRIIKGLIIKEMEGRGLEKMTQLRGNIQFVAYVASYMEMIVTKRLTLASDVERLTISSIIAQSEK